MFSPEVIERFWNNVAKAAGDECWPWTGNLNSDGYGRIGIEGDVLLAHRVSYIINVGPLTEAECALHRCDNPPCVRPDHLFKGDRGDNARDMAAKGRQHLQVNREAMSGDRHWTHRRKELVKLGSDSVNASLTEAQVFEIRQRVAAGEKKSRLAVMFGVGKTTIGNVAAGVLWKHVDGPLTPLKTYRRKINVSR